MPGAGERSSLSEKRVVRGLTIAQAYEGPHNGNRRVASAVRAAMKAHQSAVSDERAIAAQASSGRFARSTKADA